MRPAPNAYPRDQRRQRPRRWVAAACALVLAFAAAACGASGEQDAAGSFPAQPIDLVVPFSAGGSADGTARQLAALGQQHCGVPIIVRNETGGSGAVGFNTVMSADPTGYTVGVAAMELALLPHLGVAQFGPDDYLGVMQYSEQPVGFAVPAGSPIRTFDDLRQVRRQINVATSGTGSIYHVAFEGMAQRAGLQEYLVNVPFDGSSAALQAALGGHTDMVVVGAAEMRPFVEDGELRALAVTGETGQYMQDVPTLRSLGLFTAAGVPSDRINTLNECFRKARDSEQFQRYMTNQGLRSVYKDAGQFDAFWREEYTRYGEVMRQAGIGVQ